jgi:hypothetical protein
MQVTSGARKGLGWVVIIWRLGMRDGRKLNLILTILDLNC